MESRALEFGTFKLKSGRISPYFINMGRALNTGAFAARTAQSYVQEISTLNFDFDYLHGPAYKGIPLAALVAGYLYTTHNLNKRWGYDRKQEKTYGDLAEKTIVGDLRDGDSVLIIDDVITTGETKIENWGKLTNFKRDLVPRGILIAVDRQEKEESGESASQVLQKKGFTLYSILTITEIMSHLKTHPINGKMCVDQHTVKAFDEYIATYGV
ncbi:MAG: orotate phosphoribosyltransferase [Theionarchaea archaeon]|nr:orotate phosphoribosyltransferase [Theionarchaea archaeon]MBU6999303.1 orotate phosphoribosyltransferase [Theionarchaea archaeon]MBU7019572.1 orotate phosphoribosyltransferase [Theionarchaea archaeon]MBU7033751.1 orotate phosphoribosyltransferase [Theionarchaea archaeon]MBU7039439.1 orotate phosphoribosyltransferase [Theionarchaea archaeon]